MVIVGQRITPEIRQTATFLRGRGIRVTCVEFTFFEADCGTRLLSQEIVVGKESDKPTKVSSGSLPIVTESEFISSLDENGRPIFARIINFAKRESIPIHWGTKGLSLNANVNGEHVSICYGYPPNSVYKQSIRTSLRDGVMRKTAVPEDTLTTLWEQAVNTGLFVPGGQDLKCEITKPLTEAQIESIIAWCRAVEEAVQKYGLKE